MSEDTATRSYRSPLRERQAAETRRTILAAAAERILDDGIPDFSVREVASQAGVSERTVYYHFPNRQAVLDALADWVDEQLRERRLHADPEDIDDLSGRIGAIFAAFEEIGAPVRAMARLSAAGGRKADATAARTEGFRRRFAPLLDQLPEDEAKRRFAVLRHLVTTNTWVTLRDGYGLDGDDAARAIVWAMEVLVQHLDTPST